VGDLAVTRAELDGLDPFIFFEIRGDPEIEILVRGFFPQRVRLRHVKTTSGRQSPIVLEKVVTAAGLWIAFLGALINPDNYLMISSSSVCAHCELAEAEIGVPSGISRLVTLSRIRVAKDLASL